MSQNPPVFEIEAFVSVDGCRKLWAECLGLLLRDARAFWTETPSRGAELTELEQAFEDVIECGPMLRYCCTHLAVEPEAVSRSFLRWCESRDAA